MNLLQLKLGSLEIWVIQQTKLILAFFSNPHKNLPVCVTGEIYYAYMGTNIGNEIDKKRPVVVLQNDRFFRNSNFVLVAPLTSQVKGIHYKKRQFLVLEEQDFEYKVQYIKKSTILVEQIRCISKQRLDEKRGAISSQKIQELKERVKYIFGIK